MIDIGLFVTGAAVLLAYHNGRGVWLRRLLLISWAAMFGATMVGAPMSAVVFLMSIMDGAIAATSLVICTRDPSRYDARAVGMVSMAMMPAHWVMAATHGAPDWTLYAAACNGGFVFQCLIAGGWLNGVGRGLGRFFPRRHRSNPVRGGGR